MCPQAQREWARRLTVVGVNRVEVVFDAFQFAHHIAERPFIGQRRILKFLDRDANVFDAANCSFEIFALTVFQWGAPRCDPLILVRPGNRT